LSCILILSILLVVVCNTDIVTDRQNTVQEKKSFSIELVVGQTLSKEQPVGSYLESFYLPESGLYKFESVFRLGRVNYVFYNDDEMPYVPQIANWSDPRSGQQYFISVEFDTVFSGVYFATAGMKQVQPEHFSHVGATSNLYPVDLVKLIITKI